MVHNMPMKILDMVCSLTHDLYNIALDSNSRHKNFKSYDHGDRMILKLTMVWSLSCIQCLNTR
jgi:hypothetical protein